MKIFRKYFKGKNEDINNEIKEESVYVEFFMKPWDACLGLKSFHKFLQENLFYLILERPLREFFLFL